MGKGLKYSTRGRERKGGKVACGQRVKVLDYGVRGCEFESHQLLPREGFS